MVRKAICALEVHSALFAHTLLRGMVRVAGDA